MSFEREEQETVITCDECDLSWNIYTRQSRIMTKMKKIGAEPIKKTEEDGRIIEATYKIDFCQLSFKKIRILTEEQKQVIRDRFATNLGRNQFDNIEELEDEEVEP